MPPCSDAPPRLHTVCSVLDNFNDESRLKHLDLGFRNYPAGVSVVQLLHSGVVKNVLLGNIEKLAC